MKKLILKVLMACLLIILVAFPVGSALFVQASVPVSSQTNTGANTGATATVPSADQTNTGANTGATATVPAADQTNTGANTGATANIPSANQTNTGITGTVPPTGQTNTGANVGTTGTVPPTGQTNTGAGITEPIVIPPVNPPSQGGGGGGGGGYISFATAPCSSVTYGEWNGPVNGYQYRDVINQIPAGCSLTVAQQEARSKKYPLITPQVLGVKFYPDGSLLRSPDWKIYIIVNGRKQFIKNWGILCGRYKGQEIFNVSYEVLAQYPEVLGVKVYADGSLLRGLDKKVYLIVAGRKQRLKTLKELSSYKGRKINDVSYEVLAQYSEVFDKNICGNASLFRSPDKKMYLIVNGKRRLINNEPALIDSRCREIIDVDQATLESYPLI